jgi:hypothetical protein
LKIEKEEPKRKAASNMDDLMKEYSQLADELLKE